VVVQGSVLTHSVMLCPGDSPRARISITSTPRIQGLGLRVMNCRSGVEGQDSGFRVLGVGCRVLGFVSRVYGLGSRV
jgi:hypothetical protein